MGKNNEKGFGMRIGIVCQLQSSGYSGGRYYAIMLAASLSKDNEVFFFTNSPNNQIRRECFADSKITFIPYGTHVGDKLDFCLVFPGGEKNYQIHDMLLEVAKKNSEKIILFSFETENWWNSFEFLEKKSPMVWLPWKKIAEKSNQIVCVSQECVKWAREYYGKDKDFPMFGVEGPINSNAADKVLELTKKNQICFFTRTGVNSSHKGQKYIEKLKDERLSGYQIIFIYGGSLPENRFIEKNINDFRKKGIEVKFRNSLTEIEKFSVLTESKILFYPEEFTGLGLPPLEASYCGTKTVCFDLPVLKKTDFGLYHYMTREDPIGGLLSGLEKWKIETDKEKKYLQKCRSMLSMEKYSKIFVENINGEKNEN